MNLTVNPSLLAQLRQVSTSHTVILEHDGCHVRDVMTGPAETCKAYMRKHWHAAVAKGFMYGMRDNSTGRLCSFIL